MNLTFVAHPDVTFGGNLFRNTPVILQYEDTPLVEVIREIGAGFTAQFSIYHPDGTKIAKVKNTQIYQTEDGRLASLKMRHEPNITACELEGKTLFEIRRAGPAALKMSAELHCPTGAFIAVHDASVTGFVINHANGEAIKINGMLMVGSRIEARIGIWLHENGLFEVGSSGIRDQAVFSDTSHIQISPG